MQEDVMALQVKIAYQEEMLDALNEVVTRQQQQIDGLERLCVQLRDKIATLSEVGGVTERSAPPPHY